MWNGMISEGETSTEEKCEQGGAICVRFSRS